MKLNIDNLYMENGEGIVIGRSSELAIAIVAQKDSIVITTPINCNVKNYRIDKTGLKEISIKEASDLIHGKPEKKCNRQK